MIEAATGAITAHPVVQSLSVLGFHFSFGGGTLRDALGATFVLVSDCCSYVRDTSRHEAPADGARFVLYRVDAGQLVMPLQEVGHVDLLVTAGGGDTLLTVHGQASDGSPVTYAVHGFDFTGLDPAGHSDSSRLDALGAAGSSPGSADFSLRETTRRQNIGSVWASSSTDGDYRLAVPGSGTVSVGMNTVCDDGCRSYLDLRVGFLVPGEEGDSVAINTAPYGPGTIRIGADTLVVPPPTPGSPALGILHSQGRIDTIISDTLSSFWTLVNRGSRGPGEIAVGVAAMLWPARSAFRSLASLAPGSSSPTALPCRPSGWLVQRCASTSNAPRSRPGGGISCSKETETSTSSRQRVPNFGWTLTS